MVALKYIYIFIIIHDLYIYMHKTVYSFHRLNVCYNIFYDDCSGDHVL